MSPIVLLFLYLNTLYLTRCDASVSRLYTNLTSDEDVIETQHATCKIATEELVASARASVTRVLTGACNAKLIDERLRTLEENLCKELKEIKMLLYTVIENRKRSTKLAKMYNDYDEGDESDGLSSRQSEIDNFNNTIQRISSVNGSYTLSKQGSIRLQSCYVHLRFYRIMKQKGRRPRKDEIDVKNESTSFFFYYWQIKRFDEKLASWKTARSERSSTFYVGQNGYAMYIKVTPRYFPDGTVFIGVGLTRGRHDSILEWPFPHKIRLELLDHSPDQTRQDRRSRIWDPSTLCSEYFWGRPKLTGEPDNPECVGLSVSRQVLFSKLLFPIHPLSKNMRYICDRDGAITIKLTVYL